MKRKYNTSTRIIEPKFKTEIAEWNYGNSNYHIHKDGDKFALFVDDEFMCEGLTLNEIEKFFAEQE